MTSAGFFRSVTRRHAWKIFLPIFAWSYPFAISAADFEIPKVEASMFDEEALGMMEFERQKMAEHLSAYAVNHLGKKVIEKDAAAVEFAKRLTGVALHLDPRNRTALVASFQFGRGLLPKPVAEMYEPSILAEFLVTRADFLAKKPGIDNETLAGYLLALAVEIDPENENAVFQFLIWERAGKTVDWGPVTGQRETAPKP